MIYKRMIANLRAQNWSALAIELGIVILSVFSLVKSIAARETSR